MILEGIVTTINPDGGLNVSPMGPVVDESVEQLVLRPFRTSTTYKNLKRLEQGVFHVTDDVEMLARAAVGSLDPEPKVTKALGIDGYILTGACRWYAFEVDKLDDREERTRIECRVVERGRLRDFFGFNRAKHAVLEAAILATRIHLLPGEEIQREYNRLKVIVDKTAGAQEHRAFEYLENYVESYFHAATNSNASR